MSTKISKNEAIDQLWRKGVLIWKLNSAQRKLYEMFKNSAYRIPVFNASRRIGKSYTLAILALETAIQKPGSMIHYACPTAVMATKIIVPTIRKLLADCPIDIKPEYFKHDRAFEFKNGSKIQIEGADEGNAERLRGTSTDLAIVDEAGFIKDLEYLINDILLPQILTTDGTLLLSSTPPRSAGHTFSQFIEKAKTKDAYIKMSIVEVLDLIKDDPEHLRKHLSPTIVQEIKESVGGEKSPTWRREFLVETITDTTYSVIPEFTDELEKQLVIKNIRPSYYDAYTVMDPGLVDGTGILFAYLDFNTAKLIVEDEFLGNGNEITTEHIAVTIRTKEAYLWADNRSKEFKDPVYLRISDNEPILLNDLRQFHNLSFIPTRKDNKESAINELRIKLQQGKIQINPQCKNLIFQLKTAIWNKNRTAFDRTKDGGHFDLVDCLIYLVRMAQWNKNPYPFNPKSQYTNFYGKAYDTQNLNNNQQVIKDIFVKKKK